MLVGCEGFDGKNNDFARGYINEDTNNNGQFDDGEPPVAGASVVLLDENGNIVDSTVTDSNGHFLFDNLFTDSDSYTIRVYAPEGFSFPDGGSVEDYGVAWHPDWDGNIPTIHMKRDEGAAEPPSQETLTLFPSEDSVAAVWGTEANFGDLDNFWVDGQSIAYLRFLLDGIPPDYLVESVTLSLYSDNSGHAAGETITATCPDPSRPWDEMGLTWNNKPDFVPGAPTSTLMLSPESDQQSVDTFDLTETFQYCQQTLHYDNYFDVMLYFYPAPAPGASRGWHSSESESPPQLMIGMKYGFE
jgi:hypothetical protein